VINAESIAQLIECLSIGNGVKAEQKALNTWGYTGSAAALVDTLKD
jgi:hypothetical protein